MPDPITLRVAAVNLKRGAWSRTTRFHDFTKLGKMLATLDGPPHIIFMGECTLWDAFYKEPRFESLDQMNALWGFHMDENGHEYPVDHYLPFISREPRSINLPGLFVSAKYVRPVRWYDETARHVYANTLDAEIGGRVYSLKSVHWNGSFGETFFAMQADLSGQMANRATVIGGDFNSPTSDPRETHAPNWDKQCGNPAKRSTKGTRTEDGWMTNTPLDRTMEHGFWNAGTEAGVFTPTTRDGVRADHILVSDQAPIELVPDSYRVHPNDVSDHWAVECQLRFGIPESLSDLVAVATSDGVHAD